MTTSSSIYSQKYQKLRERLREARMACGMTQVEVARALERPQSFVSRCESGDYRIDVFELQAFAALYGKSLWYFFGEQDADL
jgi:transcriptional regulator with XRE-family HTH domain